MRSLTEMHALTVEHSLTEMRALAERIVGTACGRQDDDEFANWSCLFGGSFFAGRPY